MPAGRPPIWDDQIVSKVKDYLNSCTDTTEQVITGESNKFTKYENRLKVKLPTIEGLAVYLGISRETVYAWEREHTGFSDIIGELRAKQAEALINNGLSGAYNSTIAKVLLSKHGYREATETETKTEITGNLTFNGIQVIKPNDPSDT